MKTKQLPQNSIILPHQTLVAQTTAVFKNQWRDMRGMSDPGGENSCIKGTTLIIQVALINHADK